MKLWIAATAAALLVLAFPAPAVGADGWRWPLVGQVITPYRNGDDPYAAGQHRGIDIAGSVGAPVVAATAGKVTFAGDLGSSGLTVGVRTADDRYDTSYLHLSAIAVREGASVAAGDRVGSVGTTGKRSAEGPHLHFGVRDAGSRHAYHDPLEFLPSPPAAPRPDAPPAVPAPVPLAARPERATRRIPVHRRVPSARRVPAPHPRRVRLPARLPRPLPAPRSRAAPRVAPGRATEPVHAPHPAERPAPHARPELGPAPAAAALGAARPAHASPATAPARPGGGRNLGWVAACAGLVAAALLGGTGEGRAAASRGRTWVAGLLRPLAGRG